MKKISDIVKKVLHFFQEPIYLATLCLLYPLNWFLSFFLRNIKYHNSVLHISFMIHIPYQMVQILRQFGLKADFLAVGANPFWGRSDYQAPTSRWPFIRAFREFLFFWRVVSKYEIIHSHFVTTMSQSGWELEFFKKLGRKVVIHYRGCEARDRERNMNLHPGCNICQNCDYDAICLSKPFIKKRLLAKKYGDFFLVTTPDLKEFVPEATYLPLFSPEIDQKMVQRNQFCKNPKKIKIVHVTVHPGIEGTVGIQKAIEHLAKKGYPIQFVLLQNIPHDKVLEEFSKADLTIGKIKMGYYANAQIEAMALGVPTITYVRPEFMTEELRNSGFIFTDLDHLEETLQYYLDHPERLEEKRKIARKSILAIHDNQRIISDLIRHYKELKTGNISFQG